MFAAVSAPAGADPGTSSSGDANSAQGSSGGSTADSADASDSAGVSDSTDTDDVAVGPASADEPEASAPSDGASTGAAGGSSAATDGEEGSEESADAAPAADAGPAADAEEAGDDDPVDGDAESVPGAESSSAVASVGNGSDDDARPSVVARSIDEDVTGVDSGERPDTEPGVPDEDDVESRPGDDADTSATPGGAGILSDLASVVDRVSPAASSSERTAERSSWWDGIGGGDLGSGSAVGDATEGTYASSPTRVVVGGDAPSPGALPFWTSGSGSSENRLFGLTQFGRLGTTRNDRWDAFNQLEDVLVGLDGALRAFAGTRAVVPVIDPTTGLEVRSNGTQVVHAAPSGGSDSTGTQWNPMNLEGAQAKVRETLRADPTARIEVSLAGGEYALAAPLRFGPEDLGTADSPVMWKAKSGETPVLAGGRVLTPHWEKGDQPGQYVAQLDPGLDFDELTVNGERQILARYPNLDPRQGTVLGGYAADALAPERVKTWSNPTTGLVRALHDKEWGGNSFRITGVDSAGNAELEWVGDNNRGSGINEDKRMVENIREELDAPGEWYYDRDSGKLYLRQAGDKDPSGARIGLGELNQLITAEGDARGTAHDITFSGIEFTRTHRTLFNSEYERMLLSDWGIVRQGAVTLRDTERVNVVGSTFRQVGGNAVMLTGKNVGNRIEDNEFRQIGASAVVVAGLPSTMRSPSNFESYQKALDVSQSGPATDDYPRGVYVGRNLITDIGNYELQVAGVQLSLAKDVTVTQNTIHDTPRAAININEGAWGGHVISKNDIWDTVQETGDHGAINAWGRDRWWVFSDPTGVSYSKNTPKPAAELRKAVGADVLAPITIEQNRIWHDSDWAIDLDDGSSRYVVRDNLLLNSGIKLRDGFDRSVSNNILVGGRVYEQVSFEDNGDSIQRNIFLGAAPYDHHGDNALNPAKSGTVFDSNLFWNNGEEITAVGSLSLEQWRARGADTRSEVADPRFTAGNPWAVPGLLDFTVAADSPAHALGFTNFPMGEFGRPGSTARPPATEIDGRAKASAESKATQQWLGATLTSIADAGTSSVVGRPVGDGRLVKDVPEGSAAAAGGLRPNDVIIAVGGTKVTDSASFEKAWAATKPGEVELTVSRAQNPVEVVVNRT